MEYRAAKRREEHEHEDGSGSGSDRISQLPDSVLQHILCFVSQTEAVQTSVLSKSWRHLGPTRPLIDFCQTSCSSSTNRHVIPAGGFCPICFKGNKEAFISLLENTFQRYHDRNIFPHELRLQILNVDSQSISVLLEKWIPIFIDNPAVASLDLSFTYSWFYGRPYFNLPSVFFKAQSLQKLCLYGCGFDEINSIDNLLFKNLHKLTLSCVIISDEALEKVISGCPLVERLVLDRCEGFKTIIISGNKNHCLNYFDISYCNDVTFIEIDAPTLESIHINGGSSPNWYPNNTNSHNYFPHLKSLKLSEVTLSTELFHDFYCNFPRLQELTLFYCRGFQELNISSRSIKRLIIHETRSWLKKIAIEVPNILYFNLFDGFLQTTLSLTEISSSEWKSHLNLYQCENGYANDVLSTILKLFGMVKAVSQSQISLSLCKTLNFKMNQIEWDFNDHPVVVQHLNLNIMNHLRPDSLRRFLNVLLLIFRPKYMKMKSADSDKEVTECLWKALIHEREKTEYGWEQHLKEVSIEASDEKGEEWHHVQWTCLPECSKNQKIRFLLKWRDGLASLLSSVI